MRIVRWTASERVDLPDLTAMSFLQLGEFRRTVRTLVSGDATFVINGFKVEPEAVASTRVRIRLQPPGEKRGAAIGPEVVTGGSDHGQIIGDHDTSFIDEAAALTLLDFTGQPVASYTVEMKYTIVPGVDDNRAYWNPGTSTEFVQITQTRHVGGFQARFVAGAPSGGEWIALATVAWDGVAVDAVDITDLRAILYEGASPFQQAAQTGTGGVEDFSRSTARADDAVGRFHLHDVVRGLQRQVQDIKGEADDTKYDWFSRVFSAIDPTDALGAKTKTMRTLDTVTFTVGDGVTDFGDYNGATGLHDLLTAIAAAPASFPRQIKIVLKNRQASTDLTSDVWNLTGAYNLSDRRIEIVGGPGDGTLGRKHIQISTVGAGTTFTFATGGGLILDNLLFLSPTNDSIFCTIGDNGIFYVKNTVIQQDTTRSTVFFTLPSEHVHCVDSTFAGVMVLSNATVTPSLQPCGAIFDGCHFDGIHITMFRGTAAATSGRCTGATFRQCVLRSLTTLLAGSIGLVDGRGATNITFDGCEINYSGDEDAIALGYVVNGGTNYPSSAWAIRNCRFIGTSVGAHAVDGGTNGALGTGWAVNITGLTATTAEVFDVVIEGCSHTGTVALDGGFLRAAAHRNVSARDCRMSEITLGAGGRYTGFAFTQGIFFDTEASTVVDHCTFNRFAGAGTDLRGFDLATCARADFIGCNFVGRTTAGVAIVIGANGFAGRIDTSQHCTIRDCRFEQWESGTNDRGVLITGSSTALHFCDNIFKDVGGRNIYASSGIAHYYNVFSQNYFDEDGTNLVAAIDMTATTNTNLGNHYLGNKLKDATAKDLIRLGDDRKFICTGNYTSAGNIKHTTSGAMPVATAIGHSETFKANIATYT